MINRMKMLLRNDWFDEWVLDRGHRAPAKIKVQKPYGGLHLHGVIPHLMSPVFEAHNELAANSPNAL
jgi:hypothetical protein